LVGIASLLYDAVVDHALTLAVQTRDRSRQLVNKTGRRLRAVCSRLPTTAHPLRVALGTSDATDEMTALHSSKVLGAATGCGVLRASASPRVTAQPCSLQRLRTYNYDDGSPKFQRHEP